MENVYKLSSNTCEKYKYVFSVRVHLLSVVILAQPVTLGLTERGLVFLCILKFYIMHFLFGCNLVLFLGSNISSLNSLKSSHGLLGCDGV